MCLALGRVAGLGLCSKPVCVIGHAATTEYHGMVIQQSFVDDPQEWRCDKDVVDVIDHSILISTALEKPTTTQTRPTLYFQQ